MDTNATPAHPPTSGSPNWATICGIVVTVLTALLVLGGMALAKFEDSLTQHGYLKNSGSVAEPLRPSATARYDDGLTITVSRPHREPDNSFRFTITYDNCTDKELRPGGKTPDTSVGTIGDSAPIVVRAGKPLDSDISSSDVIFLDRAETVSALMPTLGEGQKRTVPIRVKPGTAGNPVTLEVRPSSAGYREIAYWQLDLS